MLWLEPMVAQLPPPESQRSHWYAYESGEFDHVPVVEVNVWPCAAFPLIAGSTLFTGTPASGEC